MSSWFYVALATSVISAISVILQKRILRGVTPMVLTWCTLVLATPIIAIVALNEGIPTLSALFLAGVVGSVLFYTISKVIQFRAMKMTDLSAVYPLISLGPIFTLLVASLPPLNENPGFIAIAGVLVTLFGAYLLNVSNAREGLFKPMTVLFEHKASALMLLAILIDSIVIVFDKLAINHTLPERPTFVLLVENILVILGLVPVLLVRHKQAIQEIVDHKHLFILLGFLNAAATILAFSAVGAGNIGIVATILKAQVLFVLLFSFLFFNDRPRFETIVGSVVMVIGVVLIKLGL